MMCGALTTDVHLRASEVHILSCSLTLHAGASLTIEAGATIYAANAEVSIVVESGARVLALGTPDEPITLAPPPWRESTSAGAASTLAHNAADEGFSVLSHVRRQAGGPTFAFGRLLVEHCAKTSCRYPVVFS